MAKKLSFREKRQRRRIAKQNGHFKRRVKCPVLEEYWLVFDSYLKEVGEEYNLSKKQVGRLIRNCHRQMRKIVIKTQYELRHKLQTIKASTFFRKCFAKLREIITITEEKMTLMAA